MTPAASSTLRPPAARPASRSRRPRAWPSAPTATTCTSPTAVSNAVVVLARNPSTGALTQATDGTGCIADTRRSPAAPPASSSTGANAVAVSPDDDNVYVTSLLSNSLTTFTRTSATGQLTQKTGTSACVIYVLAVGCSLGRALERARGARRLARRRQRLRRRVRVGRVDVFNRNADSGALIQKSRARGLRDRRSDAPDCRLGRGRCARSARSPSAPTASTSTRRRSGATRSPSSNGSPRRMAWMNDRTGRRTAITRGELLKTAAAAATPGLLLGGRARRRRRDSRRAPAAPTARSRA